ncbi:MAG: zinc-binding dehydrogenase [Xenococcaceae cyanobacterium MO_234.B1]|nr:zinc-binding dehydrogenase [Xenococcaceae cyanobacterium MO_234.B1]
MKAIQISQTGSYSALQYTEVATPSLNPNEVLIRVKAAPVNFIDALIRSGKMPPHMMPNLPIIPGVECSGAIKSVGENVTEFKVGQPVVYLGKVGARCYADYVVADASYVTPLPEQISLDEAAAIPVNYSTAYHMLHNLGQAKPGQNILVHAAAGGVGTALIQLGKIAELKTIGLVSSDDKLRYIQKQGADYGINYKTENVVERVKEITKGQGVNLSLNPIGGDTVLRDVDMLASFGQVIIFGIIAGVPQGNLEELLIKNFSKSLAVRASDIYTLYDNDYPLLASGLKTLFSYLAQGKIEPQINKRIPLSEAAYAHELLESGKVQGKLILNP